MKDDIDFSKSKIWVHIKMQVFLPFQLYKSLLNIFQKDSEYTWIQLSKFQYFWKALAKIFP